ncbi:MAG: phosphatidylglycerol lysyltransferase domain-containing protein [Candidatus Melainabacteria bacterium]|nr:phosphatidylglycerol lysyltransferase domain-containing protein [Candidatus Melainabacteria bacterium]
MDYYKLWDDKDFFFGKELEGFLAYANFSEAAMVLGDPVGKLEDFPALVHEFKQAQLRKGNKPCFFQLSSQRLDLVQEQNFTTVKIGNEALVNLEAFDIADAKHRELRARLRLLDSLRYKVRHYKKINNKELFAELRKVSRDWLNSGEEEKRFALGAYSPDYIRERTVMTVENFAGNVVAFISLVPSGVDGELNMDLMRYSPEVSADVMDYLVLHAILFFKELDYKRLNLGMIPSLLLDGSRDHASMILKALMTKMKFLFVQPSLIEIKKRFADNLRPRYFAYLSDK